MDQSIIEGNRFTTFWQSQWGKEKAKVQFAFWRLWHWRIPNSQQPSEKQLEALEK